MTPTRIQRTRRSRYPAGNVLTVTRPGAWGNPYRIVKTPDGYMVICALNPLCLCDTREAAQAIVVKLFRVYLADMRRDDPEQYAALLERVRAADFVACWCPLGTPCHGNVWIEAAQEMQL